MTDTEIKNIHEDLELLKRDMAVIKHILSEEGELTPQAKKRLEKARKTSINEYISNDELKKKLLK